MDAWQSHRVLKYTGTRERTPRRYRLDREPVGSPCTRFSLSSLYHSPPSGLCVIGSSGNEGIPRDVVGVSTTLSGFLRGKPGTRLHTH